MPELNRNFTAGRMNKDLDERIVPKGEYRDALNIEVSTSEGSDVGTVQTLKGNTALTTKFSGKATCVGQTSSERDNKLYWFVSDPEKNPDASTTLSQAEQEGGGTVSIVHNVYSDYIMEYDEVELQTNYVAVEHYKVVTTISNDSHGTNADHLHVSNLSSTVPFALTGDIRPVGIQVGMDVYINGMLTSITKIEEDTVSFNGWRVYTEHTAADPGYAGLDSVAAGDTVTFELPFLKRALGFSYFANQKPKKSITGINIIDDLLFWTDGLTEPKKINIKRCIYGSQQLTPNTYINGTRAFPTLLVVNGESPSHANGRLGDISVHPSAIIYPFLSYKQTTVIKKSPIEPLILTMSNTTKPDKQPFDGLVIVDTEVTVPSNFFFDSSGDKRVNGQIIPTSLTFNPAMDWDIGDTIEWFAEDDDAGFQDEPIAVLIVESVSPNNTTFTFEVQSISPILIKPYLNFRVRLQQDDPLFEFKFPRFAYRWKYEDGEYSCYSPFSEVAFLPDEFDYLPKKGYNLGMTNNLRHLVLSAFKPTTMPLDVVEIDILYKESNSPNVYTVDTIKAPSKRVDYLGTDSYGVDSANAWFGRIKYQNSWQEIPSTLNTSSQLVGVSALTGGNTGDFYTLEDRFSDINLKVGDTIELGNAGNIGAGTLVVSGMQNTVVTITTPPTTTSLGTIPGFSIPQTVSQISITVGGVAVTGSAGTWLTAGNTTTFSRNVAQKPAVYVTDPRGSLQVKTDMIYATVPSNQLLRPYDNVPRSALAQEITGNRVVYGNYLQNYNLTDANNELTKVSFTTKIHTRSNIRSSVRYDDRTALIHPTNGTTIDWWDALNAVKKEVAKPERSLKSLRDYQVGVVYVDEFGRQTPIQTHDNAVKRIPKSYANEYNSLRIQLDPNESTFPDWATHFKFYIKENANEYYNLAMDRFYSAEDGNIWLSFPSSERNKVDEETFLILKKQHDNDTFVSEEARYKILAISNEAPLFVKTKMDSFGIVTPNFSPTGFPKIDGQFIDIESGLFTNTSLEAALDADNERVVRISSPTSRSRYYDIVSINTLGSYERVTVSKPFEVDVAFTTDDNTNSGNKITEPISINLAKKEVKNLPEFSGRFFVKIHKDGTFVKNITSKVLEKTFIVTSSLILGNHGTSNASPSATGSIFYSGHGKDFWHNDAFDQMDEWFIDNLKGAAGVGIHQDNQGAPNNFKKGIGHSTTSPSISNGKWINEAETQNSFDIALGRLAGDKNSAWSALSSSASTKHRAQANKLKTTGTLFRFKGDSTVYKITGARYHSVENYIRKSSHSGYSNTSNHREKWRVEFTPKLGTTGKDAVAQDGSGYNPFNESKEGDGRTSDWKNNFLFSDSNNHKRTIEFIEEFAADESYTSDNPAIWETEPKENVDVDLYNEASAALPIGKEFDTYKNEFYVIEREKKYNALEYYNCFSFNNGVESNRIRDDFNTVTIDKGPKVSTVLAEQYKEENRKSGLIYSGIFNSISGVNSLNQFIQAEKITKDINPAYGSIQKLHSRSTADGDLIALCEDRVLKILADKDALFNADGNTNVTATSNVLGQAIPYSGENGISTDPESFAFDQYRCYFTDKSRGAVMRLSRDGLTPISDHGMRDYFKDVFKINNLSLIGSYDDNKKLYNLTIKEGPNNSLKPEEVVTDTAGDGLDFIDFADANIIGYIPFDQGSNPGSEGDGTGPFASGSYPPYAYGVIGNPSTTFNNANGNPVQAFGQYDVNNTPSAGGSGGGYGPNVTQIHLPVMDWFSAAIASRMSALIDAFNNCPNGDVYLHAQISPGANQGRGEMPASYSSDGNPHIVTFKVNSINFTGTRYELDVTYFSGLHAGNITSYYFWYSTSGCDISGGGDPASLTSLSSGSLGFVEITASFSEDSKGWSSFKSWLQESGVSLNDDYFTFNKAELYQHHSNEVRNNFYGVQYNSLVCAVFNDAPSSVKSFSTLSYEGSQSRVVANITDEEYYNQVDVNGWYADYISTDLETGFVPEFREKEGKWFNYIKGNQENTLSNLNVKQFSTQGIGIPSAVSSDETDVKTPFTLTIKDTGDTD